MSTWKKDEHMAKDENIAKGVHMAKDEHMAKDIAKDDMTKDDT